MRDIRHMTLAMIVGMAAVLLLLVAAQCAPVTRTVEAPATEDATSFKTATLKPITVPTEIPPETFERRHVEDQLILTGPAEQVNFIIETVSGAEEIEYINPVTGEGLIEIVSLPELECQSPMEMWYLDQILATCDGLSQYRDAPHGGQIVMVLCKIVPASQPQLKVVIEQIRKLSDYYNFPVSADYNFGTGGMGGEPWSGGGSPWSGGGSPWTDQLKGKPAVDEFLSQWALGSEGGIGLIDVAHDSQTDGHTRSTTYTGNGVRVGVFDASPISEPGVITYYLGTQPLTLTQKAFWPIADWPTGTVEFSATPLVLRTVDDHGLFVAGLIHAVAPGSEIHLYRVLQGDLRGTLFTLNSALHTFIEGALAERHQLNGAVINLSLGSPSFEALPPDLVLRLLIDEPVAESELRDALKEHMSLYILLSAARCHNMVVVAAAGNEDSITHAPAISPDCLAVAASDYTREKACFSNRGTVMAPGGNGVGSQEEKCNKPPLDECSGESVDDCSLNGLIGPVSEGVKHPSGLAYGAGTSFSTPLVSGLAALIMEEEGEGNWISPDCVIQSIKYSADNHGGVINVPDALSYDCATGPQ